MHKQMMDNNSYNVIMALASGLEAQEAFHKYAQDGNQQMWEQIAQHNEQIISLLKQQLPQVLQQSQQGYATQSQSGGMSGQQQQSSLGGQSQSGMSMGSQGNMGNPHQ